MMCCCDIIMKDVKNSILITVSTPKVVPIVTEPKEKKTAILRNNNGDFVMLKAHQLKKELVVFLERSGISVEYGDTQGRRGVSEISGVFVKVSPINHTNYDGGAYIKVPEQDDLDCANTVKILRYLKRKGIDLDKYCKMNGKGTSCLAKVKESPLE
jgi:ferredoxin